MNRERAKELLPIIVAFVNGEEIECHLEDDLGWLPDEDPSWSNLSKYRIKPKPREFNICPSGGFIQCIYGESQWTGDDAEWIKVREIL